MYSHETRARSGVLILAALAAGVVCRNEKRRSGVKPKRTKAGAKKEDTT